LYDHARRQDRQDAAAATIALALLLTWLVGKLERLLTPWRQEA
jgi:ABC-type nitrate/sulfonate/bicarbonate transport system permease component